MGANVKPLRRGSDLIMPACRGTRAPPRHASLLAAPQALCFQLAKARPLDHEPRNDAQLRWQLNRETSKNCRIPKRTHEELNDVTRQGVQFRRQLVMKQDFRLAKRFHRGLLSLGRGARLYTRRLPSDIVLSSRTVSCFRVSPQGCTPSRPRCFFAVFTGDESMDCPPSVRRKPETGASMPISRRRASGEARGLLHRLPAGRALAHAAAAEVRGRRCYFSCILMPCYRSRRRRLGIAVSAQPIPIVLDLEEREPA
jgi:hypothetical protein